MSTAELGHTHPGTKAENAEVALDILESPPETPDLCRDISDLPVKPKSNCWDFRGFARQRMATIHSGQGGIEKITA